MLRQHPPVDRVAVAAAGFLARDDAVLLERLQDHDHRAFGQAELERDLAESRAEKDARESELNDVTEEMIEKEDIIDSLRDQLGRLGGDPPPSPGPSGKPDWTSPEF